MDYEIMMNGNVKIGQVAPEFEAITTKGYITLADYLGKWVVLFSYPEDFSNICGKELIKFSKLNTEFERLNTYVIRVKC